MVGFPNFKGNSHFTIISGKEKEKKQKNCIKAHIFVSYKQRKNEGAIHSEEPEELVILQFQSKKKRHKCDCQKNALLEDDF